MPPLADAMGAAVRPILTGGGRAGGAGGRGCLSPAGPASGPMAQGSSACRPGERGCKLSLAIVTPTPPTGPARDDHRPRSRANRALGRPSTGAAGHDYQRRDADAVAFECAWAGRGIGSDARCEARPVERRLGGERHLTRRALRSARPGMKTEPTRNRPPAGAVVRPVGDARSVAREPQRRAPGLERTARRQPGHADFYDTDDPATVGCMLAQVEDATGDGIPVEVYPLVLGVWQTSLPGVAAVAMTRGAADWSRP